MRLCLLVCLILALTSLSYALSLTFPAEATVNGDQILLADVAKIEGTADEVAALGKISLGVSPVTGMSVPYTEGRIRVRLRQCSLDPDAITISCPKIMTVTRLATKVDGEVIVATAEQWLRDRLTVTDTAEVTMMPLRIPTDVQLPDGQLSWECTEVGGATGSLRSVQVRIAVENRLVWSGLVSFRLQRCGMVLVAKSNLARNAPVTANDVSLQRSDLSETRGTPLTDVAQLDHCRAATLLHAGDVLTTACIETTPIVKCNEDVRVFVVCGALVVHSRAVACSDGVLGAVISVRNPVTRQEYSAKVVGSGELQAILPE